MRVGLVASGWRQELARPARVVVAAVLAVLLLFGLQSASVVLAATFDVSQTGDAADANVGDGLCDVDTVTDGNQCSLRAAVQTANALGGSHVIRLPAGTYSLTLTGQNEDASATGDLDVTASIAVRSADSTAGTVTLNGNNSDRVFEVRSGGTLTVVGITIANGNPGSAGGGAILSGGTLTLLGTTVSGSTAGGDGGGINVNSGTTTLYTSTVSGNTASNGGGIRVGSGATLTLTNTLVNLNTASLSGGGVLSRGTTSLTDSTVQNNRATAGGGIDMLQGLLTVAGVTVSGNTSTNRGGGFFLAGGFGSTTATLTNVTVSGNSSGAFPGAGIHVTDSNLSNTTTVNLTNVTVGPNAGGAGDGLRTEQSTGTIMVNIANTIFASDCSVTGSTTINDRGGNVADSVNGAGCVGTSGATNLVALADNGGFTQTHALGSGSIALNAGTGPGCPTTDQRGLDRSLGGACDAGAYELNVSALNSPPVISSFPNQTLNEDNVTGPIGFRIADTDTPGGAGLSVSVSASTSPAFPTGAFSFTGAGNARVLFGTPDADESGTGLVTVRVSDGGANATSSFTLAVNAVNDAPSFNALAINPPAVSEDAGAQAVAGFASGMAKGPATAVAFDESSQTLTFNASVTGTTGTLAFTAAPAVDASTGTLTYTPAPDTSGTATVSVALQDSGGTANGGIDTSAAQTFTITVNAVNDPPIFSIGGNPSANEDAGLRTLSAYASGMTPGPADETGQTLAFNVSVTGTTGNLAFASAPAIDVSTGNLTYQPAANTNGTVTVQVTLSDNGSNVAPNVNTSAPQTFTITVIAINDAPEFTLGGSPPASNMDAGPQTVNAFATGIRPGPVEATDEAGQALTFNVSVTGTTGTLAFTSPPAINEMTGNLTYTAAANTSGTATVQVTLSDNGSNTAPNANISEPETFTITVGLAPTTTPTSTPTPTGTLPPASILTPTSTSTQTPTSTLTPTGTPTPTTTGTPTWTPTTTLMPTSTGTATPTPTGTTTPTPTATTTPIPPSAFISPGDDDTDRPRKETEEERQQRQHTNAGNRDDVYTEGNVVEVGPGTPTAYVVIANRDGLVRVNLHCDSQCPAIRVGDYLQAGGTKQTEAVFDATEVTVSR